MLCWRLARLSLQKNICFSNVNGRNVVLRTLKTSKKNSEASAATATATASGENTLQKSAWQSYGFDINETADRAHMHLSFLFGITLCGVFCAFYVAYAPTDLDWEIREGYLELRRREKLGLPLIDPNYVDPKLIKLPTDEELGDTEIII